MMSNEAPNRLESALNKLEEVVQAKIAKYEHENTNLRTEIISLRTKIARLEEQNYALAAASNVAPKQTTMLEDAAPVSEVKPLKATRSKASAQAQVNTEIDDSPSVELSLKKLRAQTKNDNS